MRFGIGWMLGMCRWEMFDDWRGFEILRCTAVLAGKSTVGKPW